MSKSAYQHYKKRVYSLLPCGHRQKDQIMAQFTSSLSAFQSEHPEADYSQLIDRFGTPEEIAAACVENTGTAELLRMVRFRRRIIAIVATVMVAVFFLWAIAVSVATIKLQNSTPGIIIATVEELPEGAVVEDETINIEEVKQ